MTRPADTLREGVQILETVLLPAGFHFRFGGEGKGAGGDFAWGEFVREDRRLELHFRWSLGLVRYHVGDHSASHESYMRELRIWEQCRYPAFSEDPKSAFHGLAHDLSFAQDFLVGSADILQGAAASEARTSVKRDEDLMAGYVGDKRTLDQLRSRFRETRYLEVIRLAKELKYPNRMTPSERRMVEIAQKKSAGKKAF